ncbi:lysophospholipid acyltransferase family protein [Desulfovibrio cuneatus]|uniref:lysophospholipid acyltransferase family protein n=1 Tax=Desulfovibrio cuneatus TaxID=159728 RepID=UPI0003FA6108|nr:lysophospholipid acyltransferase family protein [Desulfovibrio cuneatus]
MPLPALPLSKTSYTTQPKTTSWLGRILPSLCFYIKLIWLVCSQSRRANAGCYTGADWAFGSLHVLHALEESGVQVQVEGVEHFLNIEGPCVFVGNHMSTMETMVLPCLIQPLREVTFVTKKELAEMPIFGAILRTRNPITVGRTNPREDLSAMLDGGAERLASGSSLIIFPQSTRSATFDPAKFNSIGIKVARKAGVPVVPVALLTDAWGVGSIAKDFGPINPARPVRIAFGAPLYIAGQGKEEHAAVCAFIEEKLAQWAGHDAQPKSIAAS